MKTLFTLLFLLTIVSATAQHPDDYRWDDRFGAPGIYFDASSSTSTPIYTTSIDGDDIYVGGLFTSAGNNIAVWNQKSSKWRQLANGVNGKVRIIKIVGDDVYVGGTFSKAGDVDANNIAVWHKNSRQWSSLGKGVNGEVISMEVFNSELHVGGVFTAAGDSTVNKIARWTGTEWKSLGEGTECGVLYGQVNCLASFQNNLWVGGTFEAAGGNEAAGRLAVWDGSGWNAPRGITSNLRRGQIFNMAVVGASLFVSGGWDSLKLNKSPNLVVSLNLLCYDGKLWKTPIQSFGSNAVLPMLASSGQDLYIAYSNLEQVNGILAKGIARWNSATDTWSSLGSGIGQTTSIAGLAASSSIVVVGGNIVEAGGQFVNNIGVFELQKNSWKPLAGPSTLGLLPAIGEMEPFIADVVGLIALGDFQYAGDSRVNGLARWNGTGWQPIGSGFNGQFNGRSIQTGIGFVGFYPSISKVIQKDGALIIGGDFSGIGTTTAMCLAEYKDGIVTQIGGGIDGPYSSGSSTPGYLSVETLLADSNDLYVGGKFQAVGSIPANNIAKWDGKQWSTLGSGVTLANALYASVNAIVKAPNGDIYIGGNFDNAGGVPVDGVARWDGKQWYNVGQTIPDEWKMGVLAMAFIGNDLYVGGIFKRANGVLASSIAKWDGQSWSSVGSGIGSKNGYAYIKTFTVKGDELYVGGMFDVAGDVAAQNIAVWNTRTQTWSAFGSGVNKGAYGGMVKSVVLQHDTVFCGGTIDNAGGKPSFSIASWLPAKPNSVEQISSSASTSTLSIQPNPAYTTATLTFSLPHAERVTISLRDALGREVQRISEGELLPGEYQTQIDCSALASGAYFCVISGMQTTLTTLFIHSK